MKPRTVLLAAVFLVLFVLFAFGPFSNSHYDNKKVGKALAQGPGQQFPVVDSGEVELGDGITPENFSFDPDGRDSLVFIHIPKTGGSNFLRHLVTLERETAEPLCIESIATQSRKKERVSQRAFCPKQRGFGYDTSMKTGNPWLISEKTLGWYCGLHPFYSEYKSCISLETKKAKYARKFDPTCTFHFATMLRHPILRFISEYLHVQRGATFSYRHMCKEQEVRDHEMPPCYPGFYDHEAWVNVTLSKFLSCESNWANNRQTLSIADLETVDCFNKKTLPHEERERRLLQSGMDNLRKFAFFGITEYQVESALLFEHTFRLTFRSKVEQKPAGKLHSAPMLNTLWNTASVYDRIAKANHLDMQLYEYALELFTSRLKAIGVEIDPGRITDEIQLLPANRSAFGDKRFGKMNFDLDVE